MILEMATLQVREGSGIQFERDFTIASQFIQSIPGYVNHSFEKMFRARKQIPIAC
ncbi:hypothetical protein [Flavobacterium praedii]|uniref:hypothetical protein n=1 Tax=Flavobacterium praedii TaxID=3002900 RepID=UPI002481A763|nr:hypothetical protein [Flavobacterium praedii]